ncbi:hypothetical protein HRG_011110 [Hirsutella rhossiliensis]|uniref:Uncharacterized protein n=1 Tax=Hirsutella rhossiliensis TaxID=111463 RepID=A0A9P8MRR2_9HYPO|nr:uncharacterized protein HRG_11110 [Hirsutella rhossiliensis]KAH0958017.1 hypothetical protein HRG_11110 [Hirsutella rhossiliensis]
MAFGAVGFTAVSAVPDASSGLPADGRACFLRPDCSTLDLWFQAESHAGPRRPTTLTPRDVFKDASLAQPAPVEAAAGPTPTGQTRGPSSCTQKRHQPPPPSSLPPATAGAPRSCALVRRRRARRADRDGGSGRRVRSPTRAPKPDGSEREMRKRGKPRTARGRRHGGWAGNWGWPGAVSPRAGRCDAAGGGRKVPGPRARAVGA